MFAIFFDGMSSGPDDFLGFIFEAAAISSSVVKNVILLSATGGIACVGRNVVMTSFICYSLIGGVGPLGQSFPMTSLYPVS